MPARIPESVYIDRINSKHNIEFIRWDGEFKNSHSKAVCRCLSDGHEWSVTITNILHCNNSCPKCANVIRRSAISIGSDKIKSVILKSKSYRLISFDGVDLNLKSIVTLECTTCSSRWMVPAKQPYGGKTSCPKCTLASRVSKRTTPMVERELQISAIPSISFVSWANGYKNKNSKAILRCEECSKEWVAGVGKIVNQGTGCPSCSVDSRAAKRRSNKSDIENSIAQLSGVNLIRWVDGYKSNKSKVIVSCQFGHQWSVSCANLLSNNRRCPSCAKHGYNPNKQGTLYALRSACGTMVKIGISNNHTRRHRELTNNTPFRWECIELLHGEGHRIADLEKEFHAMTEQAEFTETFDGYTEWRKWDPSIPKMFDSAR